MSKVKRPALGRGLGALIPQAPAAAPPSTTDEPNRVDVTMPNEPPGVRVRHVPIEQISPNPDQPRKDFDSTALDELAASIKQQGIIQPIIASLHEETAGRRSYIIVAGERRWRAAQRAGLHEVPVVVRDVNEDDRLEVALIENIQRADLNPIEEARAYAELVRLRGYTQEELAGRVGKERSTVANAMRLLRLPDRVQTMVRDGRLSMGHARALLGLEHEDEMNALATEIVHDKLSVRATESAVRKRQREAKPEPPADPEGDKRKIIVGELENRLRRRLGVRVRMRTKTKDAGTIEIPYTSLDELDRLLKVVLQD